jgi:hypothetical protein
MLERPDVPMLGTWAKALETALYVPALMRRGGERNRARAHSLRWSP